MRGFGCPSSWWNNCIEGNIIIIVRQYNGVHSVQYMFKLSCLWVIQVGMSDRQRNTCFQISEERYDLERQIWEDERYYGCRCSTSIPILLLHAFFPAEAKMFT